MRKVLLYIVSLALCLPLSAQRQSDFISAIQAFSDEDYPRAEAILNVLHAKDSTDEAVSYYLGMCEFVTGKLNSAEQHLTEAVKADSTNTWYISSLASFYNATHRMDETADLCEKLLKMKPQNYKNPYTLCLIGDARLNQGRDSIAVACYEEALEIDPEYAAAQIGKAEAMRIRGNFPAYFVSLDNFISNITVDPTIKSDYMEALFQNIDARFYWAWGEQLCKLVDKCVELHPEDIKSRLNKVQTCAIKQDTLGMINQCAAIIPLATEQKDTTNLLMALSTIGDFNYMLGNRKEAYKTYDIALKIDPRCVAVLNNYAYYLSEEHRKLKKALQMSKITIEEEPDNATYLDTYAWILHLLKRSAEAKPYFKHAMLYGGKDSAVILQHYSEVLEALGEKDLASYYHSLAEQKKK